MSIREIKRTALVTFTPPQMFDLVVDVERYHEFLPWVAGAEIHQRSERDLVASITMERAGVRQSFTTRNEMDRPDWMTLELVEGPFRLLEGRWTFASIGSGGATSGTRIVLEMRFEFANPIASMLFGKAFEQSVGELIDAFVVRAKKLYGAT
jgi:ribosome-associated toxin RatA of RatAB toxin-antitoxin module